MPTPLPEQLKELVRPRINRAPSPLLAISLPWILVMLAFLMLITYVPIISLWLPNLLMP